MDRRTLLALHPALADDDELPNSPDGSMFDETGASGELIDFSALETRDELEPPTYEQMIKLYDKR